MPRLHVNISPMKAGTGEVVEIYLDRSAGVHCAPELIPQPGQYLLAHADGSDSPLAVPLFFGRALPDGFRTAPISAETWLPGTRLNLAGPLGHGFILPAFARKTALVAYDDDPSRLLGLMGSVLNQGSELVLVTDVPVEDIPESIEIQPLKALEEILRWSDFAAIDAARENLEHLLSLPCLKKREVNDVQVLVRAPMPCGTRAECGVCALSLHHEWKMICKEGPVFRLQDLR